MTRIERISTDFLFKIRLHPPDLRHLCFYYFLNQVNVFS